MSKTLKLAGLTAVALSLLGAGTAQAASRVATANAAVLKPIVITEDASMDFGSVVAPTGAAANFVLDVADTVGTCPTTCLGTPASGAFTLAGAANQAVAISFSAGDTLIGPGPAMALGTYSHNAGGAPTLDPLGALSFNVGATLTVGDGQTDGNYTGTYTVTVNYN